jgi:uncharacterized protein (DUF111 family)
MNPEWFGHVGDLLWDAGAKDVYLTPVQMKKGRPATLVTVLCSEDVADALTLILLRETTTLGVRRSSMQRTILPRKAGTVNTEYGDVRVKKAEFEGRTRVTPEYDDCLRIAREKNIAIAEVYAAVQRSS